MTTLTMIPSGIEMLRRFMQEQTMIAALVEEANVIVGPASFTSEIAGAIILSNAGAAEQINDLPLKHDRIQIRVLADTVDRVEQISRTVYDVLHGLRRTVMLMPSADKHYLVHQVLVNGDMSIHRDSDVNWEGLMFVNMLYGLGSVEGV